MPDGPILVQRNRHDIICPDVRRQDADELLQLAQDREIKAALIAATEAAVARGIFGAPTFFMDGEMYFGQDRLNFVQEALEA